MSVRPAWWKASDQRSKRWRRLRRTPGHRVGRPAPRRGTARAGRTPAAHRVGRGSRGAAPRRNAQPQRQAVGRAAKRGEVVVARATGAGAAHTAAAAPAAVQAPAAEVQVALAGQRADGGRAQFLDAAAGGARRAAARRITARVWRAPRVRLVEFAVEAALEVLGDDRPLGVVALVGERQPEGQRRVAEDLEVLGPGDHRARRHQRRQVARGEALARQLGHAPPSPHQRRPARWPAPARAPARSRPLRRAAGSSAWRRCSSGRSARGSVAARRGTGRSGCPGRPCWRWRRGGSTGAA